MDFDESLLDDDASESEIDDETDGEDMFVVEAILGEKKEGKMLVFEVKWKGYEETSWEPRGNLSALDVFKAYQKSKTGQQ